MKTLTTLLAAGLLALLAPAAWAAPIPPGKVIAVCDGGEEWPPYTYYKRSLGIKTNELVGYAVEYLQRVLARKNLRFSLELIPWKRCMAMVDSGQYDMLLNASNNDERDRTFLVSKPYYALTLVYFYDTAKPQPDIRSPADLKTRHLCGVRGYNYAPFGLAANEIDTEAPSQALTFLKLKKGRCEAVPERLEIAIGYKILGVVDFDKLDIAYEAVPGLSPSPFSMMVSRHTPYAEELLAVLNEGIAEISAKDGASDLAAKYSIPGVKLPSGALLPPPQ